VDSADLSMALPVIMSWRWRWSLGVITKILLKLIPKPVARRTMLVTYDRITDAAVTVSAIIAAHRVERAMAEIFDRAIALGGTITGEHGVGLAKKAFLPRALGSTNFRVMRDFKRVMDPEGILNPGKIFE